MLDLFELLSVLLLVWVCLVVCYVLRCGFVVVFCGLCSCCLFSLFIMLTRRWWVLWRLWWCFLVVWVACLILVWCSMLFSVLSYVWRLLVWYCLYVFCVVVCFLFEWCYCFFGFVCLVSCFVWLCEIVTWCCILFLSVYYLLGLLFYVVFATLFGLDSLVCNSVAYQNLFVWFRCLLFIVVRFLFCLLFVFAVCCLIVCLLSDVGFRGLLVWVGALVVTVAFVFVIV